MKIAREFDCVPSFFSFLARWRHHAQVCQCPGSKRVNFRSAPFASLFRTKLEISESACSYTQICPSILHEGGGGKDQFANRTSDTELRGRKEVEDVSSIDRYTRIVHLIFTRCTTRDSIKTDCFFFFYSVFFFFFLFFSFFFPLSRPSGSSFALDFPALGITAVSYRILEF